MALSLNRSLIQNGACSHRIENMYRLISLGRQKWLLLICSFMCFACPRLVSCNTFIDISNLLCPQTNMITYWRPIYQEVRSVILLYGYSTLLYKPYSTYLKLELRVSCLTVLKIYSQNSAKYIQSILIQVHTSA